MTSQIKSSAPQLKTTLLGDESQSRARQAWYWQIICQAFVKLEPRQQIRNPVIFLVELGAMLTTILFIVALLGGSNEPPLFIGVVAAWLWLTVLLANLAESLIEGSVRIRAETWHQRCRNIATKKLSRAAGRENYDLIPAADLRKYDLILVEAGEIIPADGEIVEGSALVDDSLLFGKNTPVVTEVGRDHTAVAGGARVLSGWLAVRLSTRSDESLLPHLINLLEAAKRRQFPYITLLNILFAGSILIVLLLVSSIWFSSGDHGTDLWTSTRITILMALLLSLVPIASSELWRLVNLAEVGQLIRANVIPVSNRAVEIAERVEVLLLDKRAVVNPNHCQMAISNVPVETDRSQIVRRPSPASPVDAVPPDQPTVTLPEKRSGSDEESHVDQRLKERLAQLRRMGVKTVLTTADSSQKAAVLAAAAGVDDFLAQTTLAARLALMRDYQARGCRVAVAGSRADEATLMRQADLAVAMNASAYPARETAGMIDLTSNPAQLVKIAEITRRWSAARRAVTFFTLASDIAKYFVLIPAVFASIFPALEMFNFIGLTTPATGILATIVFSAVSIVFLSCLARRGMPDWAWDTVSSPVYVLVGLLTSFVGIKVIDLVLASLEFV